MCKYKERRNGPNFKRQRTALDDLASLERTKINAQILKENTDSEFKFSDVDNNVSKNIVDYSSDSSGKEHSLPREQVFLKLISQQVPKYPK